MISLWLPFKLLCHCSYTFSMACTLSLLLSRNLSYRLIYVYQLSQTPIKKNRCAAKQAGSLGVTILKTYSNQMGISENKNTNTIHNSGFSIISRAYGEPVNGYDMIVVSCLGNSSLSHPEIMVFGHGGC